MAMNNYRRDERSKRREHSASQASYNDYLRNFYSPTSEAYALPAPKEYPASPEYPETYPNRDTRKPAKRAKRVRKSKKKAVHLEYVHSTEKEKHLSFMSVVLFFFLFSGALVSLLTFAAVGMKNIELNDLKAGLKETKEIRENLIADISQGIDLAKIEQTAVNKLHMSKPKDYQIIEVSVPKQTYFVQYEAETEIEPIETGVKSILDLLNINWIDANGK